MFRMIVLNTYVFDTDVFIDTFYVSFQSLYMYIIQIKVSCGCIPCMFPDIVSRRGLLRRSPVAVSRWGLQYDASSVQHATAYIWVGIVCEQIWASIVNNDWVMMVRRWQDRSSIAGNGFAFTGVEIAGEK